MSDQTESLGGDAFTAEEQAMFDAYERGEDAPAAPVDGEAAPAPEAAPVAPEAAASPGAAAAPGDVVDPEAEDGSPEENKGKFVRHGAFHQERERRKSVERELSELREKYARGDERLRLLSEAMTRAPQAPAAAAQPAPEPEAVPDPNEDIFGYVKHLEKQLAAVANGHKEMTEAQKQQAEQTRVAEEERTIVGAYQRDIERYAATEPAFVEAYQHLVQGRVAELKLYGLTDQQAIAQANADELAFVRSAVQRNLSPAEQAFALAKSRGFQPKAPAPAAAAAAPAETPAERQARIAAGQAASKSLSGAGGGPAGEMTLEMLATMSEADFEAFAAKNPGKLEALMGA
ncbi:hypothetical protein [Methylorubrum aminovorans]|uniref:hypothetical protein n=1 Tax=Methylorubrum aminovorans TaxID=269069 RepID=UPI003C2CA6F8